MNTKAASLGIGLAATAALVLGGGWFIQEKVATSVREQIETRAAVLGAKAQVANVSYSLLGNTLEVGGVKLVFANGEAPAEYSVEKGVLKNPNRSLLLALVNGDVTTLKGLYPVADSLTVLGYTTTAQIKDINAGNVNLTMTIPEQSVSGIGVDMDAVGPLLAKEKPTDNELLVGLVVGLSYAERSIPKGSTAKMTSDTINIDMSTGPMGDTKYSGGSLESAVMTDLKMSITQQGVEEVLITLKETSLKNLYLSPEVLNKALKFSQTPNPDPKESEKLLMDLFAGERPFLGMLEMKDFTVKLANGTYKLGGFRYENSSTKPFTFLVALDHIVIPVALLQTIPSFAEVSGMIEPLIGGPDIDVTTEVSGIVPLQTENKDALAKLAGKLTVAALGTLDVRGEGRFKDTDFLATQVAMSYTDNGLTPKAVKLAGGFIGFGPDQVLTYVDNLLKAEVASGEIKAEEVAPVMDFLKFPGTVSITVTAKEPTKIDVLLEDIDMTSENTKLEVTKGEKSLEELVKASK